MTFFCEKDVRTGFYVIKADANTESHFLFRVRPDLLPLRLNAYSDIISAEKAVIELNIALEKNDAPDQS